MDHHPSFPFTRLPEDIQVRVLLNLEAPDILRFQQASKALSKLGDELAVQYKIQLDIAGMVDNPHHASPMIERFRKLLEYQEGWHKHALAVDPNIPVPVPRDLLFGLLWEFEGGVFPYIVNSRSSQQQTLHLYRPGSPLRGIKPQNWMVEPAVLPSGYRYLGCGIDVAQDLLILSLMPFPYDPENERACIFQLQSLRRPGMAHPQASRHILLGQSLRTHQAMSTVQICENIVACAIYQDEWGLNLWNWKTGTLRVRLRFPQSCFQGFTLLTPSYLVFLTGSQADPEMSLSVYRIPSQDSAPDSLSTIRQNDDDGPDVVLKLMPFSDEHVNSILAYLSYSRETTSPDDSPLFEHNPDLAILTLFFSVYANRPDRHVDQFLLVASVSGIVRTLDRVCASISMDASRPEPLLSDTDTDVVEPRPRILEWDEWGPQSTRLIGLTRELWNDAPTPSRTRCALAFQGTPSPGADGNGDHSGSDTHLFVITAHPHSTLAPVYGRSTADGNKDEHAANTASFLVYEDVFTSAPHVFRAPVRSTLPVSVSCHRRLAHHPAPYLGIGLFEDGLSVMYLYEPDDPRSGEMFMFCV